MQNSFAVFTYWFNYLNQYNEYLKKLTQYKNEIRDGVDAGAGASTVAATGNFLQQTQCLIIQTVFNCQPAAKALYGNINPSTAKTMNMRAHGATM